MAAQTTPLAALVTKVVGGLYAGMLQDDGGSLPGCCGGNGVRDNVVGVPFCHVWRRDLWREAADRRQRRQHRWRPWYPSWWRAPC